jgi:hypothetical protein
MSELFLKNNCGRNIGGQAPAEEPNDNWNCYDDGWNVLELYKT